MALPLFVMVKKMGDGVESLYLIVCLFEQLKS